MQTANRNIYTHTDTDTYLRPSTFTCNISITPQRCEDVACSTSRQIVVTTSRPEFVRVCVCVCKEHIKCCEFVCRFPRCSHDSSSASCQMQIQIQTAGAEAETNADVDTDTDTNCAPCGQCCLPVCCQACAIIYLLCTHTHTLTVYMSVYVSLYTNSYAYIPFILAYQVEVPFVFIYFVQLINGK